MVFVVLGSEDFTMTLRISLLEFRFRELWLCCLLTWKEERNMTFVFNDMFFEC